MTWERARKCAAFGSFSSNSLPLVCQMDNGMVRQISAEGLSCSQEGRKKLLDWRKYGTSAKRFDVAAQIEFLLFFFLTASMHVSCRTLSLLEWKSARASQSVRDQMLRGGDRKQMEEPGKADLCSPWCKKPQKPKTNTHMGKKACLSDRKTWKAGWKVRGEGGLLRASPDKSAADLRQQVLVDRRSQTHGGSVT